MSKIDGILVEDQGAVFIFAEADFLSGIEMSKSSIRLDMIRGLFSLLRIDFIKIAYVTLFFSGFFAFFAPLCWPIETSVTPSQKNLIETPRPIYMIYFFEPGCRLCDSKIASILVGFNKNFPQLEIRYSNVAQEENRLMQASIGKLYEVPLEERLISPAIYMGKHYFIGEIDFKEVEKVLKDYTVTGTENMWMRAEKDRNELQQGILPLYLERLKIPTLIIAGLIDGINPCAFSIVIFLITFMSYLRKRRDEMFQAGILFIIAVFLTYFFTGLGFLEFFRRANLFPLVRKSILITGAIFCALAGTLSIADYFALKENNTKKIFLRIPLSFQRKVNTSIGRMIRHKKHFFLGALVAGFLASSVEFICTGQIYFPTLIFLSQAFMKKEIIGFLVIYNLFFVLPLLGVFLAVYFGLSIKFITHSITGRFSLAKILLAGVFFSFCAFLISMVV